MKSVICYFSCTGNTALAAKELAEATGAEVFRILPQKPYSAADLDWTDQGSRCYQEHLHPEYRPEIKEMPLDFSGYDRVYLGFPIWWGVAPDIVKTFLDRVNLAKVEIFPFGSSYSSLIDEADAELHKDYPNLNWHSGLRFPTDSKTLKAWIRE